MFSSILNRNKDKKNKRTYLQNFGFTFIYNDLISQALPITKIKDATEALLFPAAFVFSLILTLLSLSNGLTLSKYILWSIYLFMIYSSAAIAIGWVVGFISFSVSFKPAMPLVIARIIIAVKAPFTKYYGLNSSDIQHLRKIAEIDQASAEWKNGFISIGILALLLAFIQWSSSEIGTFLQSIGIIQPQEIALNNFRNVFIFLAWLFSTTITFGLAFSIFSPLVEFLANEPINRAILNVCEEALAILEALNLQNKSTLTMSDKKKVAEKCLCQIVPQPKDNRFWDLKTNPFKDNQGKEWLLLPPAALLENSVQKAEARNNFFEKIKSVFSKNGTNQRENKNANERKGK